MKENLSAWMDGELGEQQARQLPQQLKRDAELRGDGARNGLAKERRSRLASLASFGAKTPRIS